VSNNLLITSAGRRGVLVGLFQQALRKFFPGSSVYASDLQPALSSACHLADGALETPPIGDPQYIDCLLRFCASHQVRALIPTIDTDLLLLAQHQHEFLDVGTTVIISDSELVKRCRDKRLTPQLFAQHGVDTPRTVNPRSESVFPLIAKPFDGSSSNNLHIIKKPSDLRSELLNDPSLVFSEYLSPCEFDEYTVDMYFDRGGELKCLVPRLRIATRAGEVSKSRTVRFEGIQTLRTRFAQVNGARGCLTAQFFVRRGDGKIFAIEMNARFGGGYPLSYESGANYPEWIVREYLMNERVEYFDDWEDQLTMLRYDQHVLVRHSAAD
jgi:carbamoyl-phosphate synthase large subunit